MPANRTSNATSSSRGSRRSIVVGARGFPTAGAAYAATLVMGVISLVLVARWMSAAVGAFRHFVAPAHVRGPGATLRARYARCLKPQPGAPGVVEVLLKVVG